MSSLSNSIPPIAVGAADAATQHSANLGKVYEVAGKRYRLVKASATVSAAENKVLITALSGSAPTWAVAATTGALSPLVAGVVTAGQTGSDGTSALASGDYFLIQVSGACTPLVHTTATAAGTCIATAATSGTGDAVSATYAATTNGTIYARLLAASSGADAATAAMLMGLD